ncbi:MULTISPECIES: restriction endonuclease subunit S [unclassified Gilliamella]|uniref:restriction endonuclease subunit S n=1 Tax=unclassified Gilliamella TaxID=2685620 RepID=UPI002269E249|nr:MULTISPECIES: restriction endonuclease subunit S [unclassified Gilliamella]MCX8601708.1 restriction endonuclease subunit S [Gilliamella sp. B3722]MCX8607807.1 restriction endonuclease subunit S [Gilliamella sp. B3771]MCX8610971.1 restriction endonuclease subunit S [Gilliamella sp. B3891]MCX8613439.1 restriction endonuclease subunit S [Gilliamella sp. B3773]MCX8615282.1 restriction endonuclease subunit S [Gilliamella sp. B3770]
MSDLPKYAHYKESGVEWLGEIPNLWEINRLKFLLVDKLKYGANESAESEDRSQPRYIRITDIDEIGNLRDETFKSLEFEKAKSYLLEDLDILLARSGATVGKSYLYYKKIVGNACYAGYLIRARLDLQKFNAEFVNYFLQSKIYWDWVKAINIQATIQNISAEKYSDLILSIPPLEEQNAIVSFLDKKIAQIDTLISKQEMLLEKLAEQRIALISHAVTKGINPDVEMKESGIEWLGDIPSHWNVWKIVHATDSIGSGTTPKSDNNEYYDGDILWVTTSELRETVIEDTKQHVSSLAINTYSALKKFPKNSVAIAMYGATIGRLGILGKEATFNQACCIFCCSNILNYKFLYYWLWMRRPILISLSNGGGQPNLNQDDLKKIKLALPPIHEQELIVRNLEKEIKRTDTLQDKINRIIINLKEYRSALITQAITGKIDVRNLNQ